MVGHLRLDGNPVREWLSLRYPNRSRNPAEQSLICPATRAGNAFVLGDRAHSRFINTVVGQLLPPIKAFMLVVHVLGFFAILIPLIYVYLLLSSDGCE